MGREEKTNVSADLMWDSDNQAALKEIPRERSLSLAGL